MSTITPPSKNADLSFMRREAHASLVSFAPEHDYIHSRLACPEGMENETYLFTFDIPEQGLHGVAYIWLHTQLRTCTSAVLIFRGVKSVVQQAEHFNCFQFLPYPQIDDDSVFVPELGLKVRVVSPGDEHEITYDNPASGTSLRLRAKGVFPAVQAEGRNHLEQAMHMTGEMVLNGEAHAIDSLSFRDRSWRGKRTEAGIAAPPMIYCNGMTRDREIAFNFCGADDPKKGADWADMYPVADADLLMEGWVLRDGKLGRAVSISKTTELDFSQGRRALSWICELGDEWGRQTIIRARRSAAIPFCPWISTFCDWGQFAFTVDGGGDGACMTNDFFYNHYGRTLRG